MSQDFKQEEASSLPIGTPSYYQNEDPQKICQSFRVRLISFVNDIERLLRKADLVNDSSFLDKVSEDIVALNNMSGCTSCCSEHIVEAGRLIQNVLSDPLTIKGVCNSMTTLQMAKKYREDRNFKDCFTLALLAYRKNKELTESLLSQLKVLAFDLNT